MLHALLIVEDDSVRVNQDILSKCLHNHCLHCHLGLMEFIA